MADDLNIMADKEITDFSAFTRFEHATVGTFYLFFCVIGVTCNFLTAVTFYKDTKLVTTSKPWLHILLAITNIAVVAPSPFPASSCFSGRWLYGNTMCQLYAFEGMFVGMVAITIVTAMCVERFCVGAGLFGADKSGWFHVWTTVLIISNALFWATMPLLGWTRYTLDYTGTSCALDWKNPDEGFVSYIISLEIFSFGIPVALAVFCLCYTNSKSTAVEESADVSDQTLAGFTEDQLTKICYVFLALVLIGWGPFAFLCNSTIMNGSDGISMLAASIPPLACKMAVSAYPLTYAIVSPRFRNSMTGIFSRTEQRKQE